MGKQKKSKKKKFSKKVYNIFKYILYIIYFSCTAAIPVYVFYSAFFSKDSILYAAAIAFIFFIVMDICCSITEDVALKLYEASKERKEKKLKEKEQAEKKKKEEMQEIEDILTEKRNYQSEVMYAESEFEEYKEYIKLLSKEVPRQVQKSLKNISVHFQIEL